MSDHIPVTALDEIERTMRNLIKYAREKVVHVPREVIEPYDGKPSIRPHTISGWWQVWSGGICIALLTPEDVAPLLEKGATK